jgi:hypothetical protein
VNTNAHRLPAQSLSYSIKTPKWVLLTLVSGSCTSQELFIPFHSLTRLAAQSTSLQLCALCAVLKGVANSGDISLSDLENHIDRIGLVPCCVQHPELGHVVTQVLREQLDQRHADWTVVRAVGCVSRLIAARGDEDADAGQFILPYSAPLTAARADVAVACMPILTGDNDESARANRAAVALSVERRAERMVSTGSWELSAFLLEVPSWMYALVLQLVPTEATTIADGTTAATEQPQASTDASEQTSTHANILTNKHVNNRAAQRALEVLRVAFDPSGRLPGDVAHVSRVAQCSTHAELAEAIQVITQEPNHSVMGE